MDILLIRHAQSEANAGLKVPHLHGDFDLALTDRGVEQAKSVASILPRETLINSLLYCSPFRRAKQTLDAMLEAHQIDEAEIFEDPLLREQDRGYSSEKSQLALRKVHGWFWYRHDGGESPADVYTRMCIFIDHLHRQVDRTGNPSIVVVSHGMAIRCFVMRFLHLTSEEFVRIRNPKNADIIRIARAETISEPVFHRGRYAVEGLTLR